MSQNNQSDLTNQLLQELIKVGVGGKFKDNNDYVKKIQEELEFEEQMVRGAVQSYNNSNQDAQAKRQEGTTLYGLVWQKKYISKLSEMINDDVKTLMQGKAGRNNIATTLMCQCLPSKAFDNGVFLDNRPEIWDVCSLIILKNTVDGISTSITLNKLSILIGSALMIEAKITLFKEFNNKQYKQIAKRLQHYRDTGQKKSRYEHKLAVWNYFINKHGLIFDKWSKDERLHLGVKCLDYLNKLGLIIKQNRKTAKNKTICYVEATPKIIEEIKKFNIANQALLPKYMPMLMPPRDWDNNPFVGGYYGKRFNSENNAEEIATILNKQKGE